METTENAKTRILLLGPILLVGVMVAGQALAKYRNGSQVQPPSVMTWQHLALTQTISETPEDELANSINKHGREGWELVSVGNITKSGTTTKTVFYFKKPTGYLATPY